MFFERNFGNIVRDKRERKGWTIKQAAERCGLSERGLIMIELGDSDPKLSNVLIIARTLEINLGEIDICIPKEEFV
ncbi:MAG: helix-turn-helix transcriptional regulator [Ruminococcaceae bacterium]|nr:helix-turn-helix transcriptional regulator [Oscillospiraceae bacterium]